jgi:hypothetical protein
MNDRTRPKTIQGVPFRQYKAVLRFCNDQRRQYGLEPVKYLSRGQRRQFEDCPVRNTIGGDLVRGLVSLTYCKAIIDGKLVKRPLPPAILRFIEQFDAGAFPELEAK